MHLNLFYTFFLMFNSYKGILSNIFALFPAQNFKTKVLTAQKNLLLECLRVIISVELAEDASESETVQYEYFY